MLYRASRSCHTVRMTDLNDPSGASIRLSNDERERAVAVLQAHAAAGRLDDAELTSRVASAQAAITRGDLAPLFADLPGPLQLDDHPAQSEPRTAQPSAAAYAPGPGAAPSSPQYDAYERGPYRPTSRWGILLVSVMPFVSVILFFITGAVWGFQYSWLWFLLIPLAGAITYGIDGPRRR
jgi:hypothetical protein